MKTTERKSGRCVCGCNRHLNTGALLPIVALATCLAVFSFSPDADALPGTHGPAVSTWDTTLSTIMFAFNAGYFEGGHLHVGSYVSNFTSTTHSGLW